MAIGADASAPDAAALDQHREGQVPAVADEPAVGRRVLGRSVLGRSGLAVDTPAGKPTPAAVPLVTTARIIGRSVSRIAGLSCCGWAVCRGAGLSHQLRRPPGAVLDGAPPRMPG